MVAARPVLQTTMPAARTAWKAPILFSVIGFIVLFLQVLFIFALLYRDSFIHFTASRLLPLANANLFGGDGFSRIRGNGWWRPASAGKNAVSVRGTLSGPSVNRSEARPGDRKSTRLNSSHRCI